MAAESEQQSQERMSGAQRLFMGGLIGNAASLLLPWLVVRLALRCPWEVAAVVGLIVACLSAAMMMISISWLDSGEETSPTPKQTGRERWKTWGRRAILAFMATGPTVGMLNGVILKIWWVGEIIAVVLFVGAFVSAMMIGPSKPAAQPS